MRKEKNFVHRRGGLRERRRRKGFLKRKITNHIEGRSEVRKGGKHRESRRKKAGFSKHFLNQHYHILEHKIQEEKLGEAQNICLKTQDQMILKGKKTRS